MQKARLELLSFFKKWYVIVHWRAKKVIFLQQSEKSILLPENSTTSPCCWLCSPGLTLSSHNSRRAWKVNWVESTVKRILSLIAQPQKLSFFWQIKVCHIMELQKYSMVISGIKLERCSQRTKALAFTGSGSLSLCWCLQVAFSAVGTLFYP